MMIGLAAGENHIDTTFQKFGIHTIFNGLIISLAQQDCIYLIIIRLYISTTFFFYFKKSFIPIMVKIEFDLSEIILIY